MAIILYNLYSKILWLHKSCSINPCVIKKKGESSVYISVLLKGWHIRRMSPEPPNYNDPTNIEGYFYSLNSMKMCSWSLRDSLVLTDLGTQVFPAMAPLFPQSLCSSAPSWEGKAHVKCIHWRFWWLYAKEVFIISTHILLDKTQSLSSLTERKEKKISWALLPIEKKHVW